MMVKQGTFIRSKMRKLLLCNIWGWLAYCVNLMTDSLISGNRLGEVSLQAVSIVLPLFSVVVFFSYLVSPGASVLFGKRIGEFEEKEAHRIAGTNLLSSGLIGLMVAGGLLLIKEPFLAYYGCTGQLYREASAYYNWLVVFAPITCIQAVNDYMAVTDGEAIMTTAAGISEITANVVLSIVLSRRFGIAGLGIATCIGRACNCGCFMLHYLKKSNNVKFRLCLDFEVIGRSIVLSFSTYMYYLFLAVVDIIMNKIIITTCGLEYIPAYSVVNLVFGVCEINGAIHNAAMGFVTNFLGEKNNNGMSIVLSQTKRFMAYVALGLFAFFFFGAPLIPILYGLETEVTIRTAIATSRIMAFTSLGFGVCYVGAEISALVEKPFQACFIYLLHCVVAPLLLSASLGYLWGFTGIAIAMSASPYVALGIYALCTCKKHDLRDFPVYVEDFGEEGISYDLYVTKESIPEVRDWVCRNLEERGFLIDRVGILIEELYTRVTEKNPGKKVLSECTLLFKGDVVRIIIRDDGTLFNFVDENNPVESLNAHVLNSLLEQTKEKNYVLTTSFNRNGFVFEKSN